MFLPRHIPNILTFARIILVFPIVWYLSVENYRNALSLFFIAGLTDAVDGFLARRFEWRSKLGAIADPLADKLLLVCTFITLTVINQIDLWLTCIVLIRDVVIVCGVITYRLKMGELEMAPTILGKLSTLCQIVFVLVVIIIEAKLPMLQLVEDVGIWVVALVSAGSGLQYVYLGSKKILTNAR